MSTFVIVPGAWARVVVVVAGHDLVAAVVVVRHRGRDQGRGNGECECSEKKRRSRQADAAPKTAVFVRTLVVHAVPFG